MSYWHSHFNIPVGAPTAPYIRIDCHITLQQVQAFHILAQTAEGRPIFPSSKYAF
jgi:hypothetical protein